MGSSESSEVPQQSGNWSTITCNGTVVNGNFNTVRETSHRRKNPTPTKSFSQVIGNFNKVNGNFCHVYGHYNQVNGNFAKSFGKGNRVNVCVLKTNRNRT